MPPLPKPIPGLVIRYSFLWSSENDLGRREGVKDRPCAIVLVTKRVEDLELVVVLPITHSPPAADGHAMEIPYSTKRRLGLDDQRSWIVLSEANEFVWPGFDLRPATQGDRSSVVYGELPASLFREIRTAFVQTIRDKRVRLVSRDV